MAPVHFEAQDSESEQNLTTIHDTTHQSTQSLVAEFFDFRSAPLEILNRFTAYNIHLIELKLGRIILTFSRSWIFYVLWRGTS